MVTELKILRVYTSNLFMVLMEQEKKKSELKLYVRDEKKKGPIQTAKVLEASSERREKT